MDREELVRRIRTASSEDFSRSGGPGGQNVNKVNTQVTLRVAVARIGFGDEELKRLFLRLANRINSEGELVIQSSESRSQALNRERAFSRAVGMITGALKPVRRRVPTRPSPGSRERRLDRKRARSERKRTRKPPDGAGD